MTKFQEYFKRMIESEEKSFRDFDLLYTKYSSDQDKYQKEFNEEGAKIMAVIKEWENKLCSQSEKAGFGNYTSNLSEKFMSEVRKKYPLIDYVGVIVKEDKKDNSNFFIRKIRL